MNFGVLREEGVGDGRVVLTPPVVRKLVETGNAVWVERGAGEGAMFPDDEYLHAGARIGYSAAEVIGRADLAVKISSPSTKLLDLNPGGTALMAFYHLAAAGPGVFQRLQQHAITAIGCEIIQRTNGRLPVLAAVSEIAGQTTVFLAAHLLRSSSGGRGILLGGSPGVPPAHVVVLGGGVVGCSAARTAMAAGARVTVLDIDSDKLRRLLVHVPNVATALADPDSIGAAVASADVVIGAVLVAGARTPHVVTRQMVESMRPGAVIIDVAIDQGGCVETSRPTTIVEPTFLCRGVVHYCVPNLTAELGRSTSMALAQALMPYLIRVGELGLEGAFLACPELARGIYTYRGVCVHPQLAAAWNVPCHPLGELLAEGRAG